MIKNVIYFTNEIIWILNENSKNVTLKNVNINEYYLIVYLLEFLNSLIDYAEPS